MTTSPAPDAHGPVAGTPLAEPGGLLPAGPTLSLASHRGPRHAVVTVDGAIDYHTAPQLLGHVSTPEMRDVPLLILDLARVYFCDSSALGAFVDVQRRRSDAGHRFALTGVQPEVRRILELTRLTTVLPLHATVEDALAAH
jgi:anti-sigma B factor antagonist